MKESTWQRINRISRRRGAKAVIVEQNLVDFLPQGIKKADHNKIEIDLSQEVINVCTKIELQIKDKIGFSTDIVLIITAILSTSEVQINKIYSMIEKKYGRESSRVKLPSSILVKWQSNYHCFMDKYKNLLFEEMRKELGDEVTDWIIQRCEDFGGLNIQNILTTTQNYCRKEDEEKVLVLKKKFNTDVDFQCFLNAVILSADIDSTRVLEYIADDFSGGANKWE